MNLSDFTPLTKPPGVAAGAVRCMSWGPDPDGVNGVYLGKNVVTCAADALEKCLQVVTPRVSEPTAAYWHRWPHYAVEAT